MTFRKRQNFDLLLGAGALSTLLVGCSFFGIKSDAPVDDNAFHTTTASTVNNPIPLPVEIANDISQISAAGPVEGNRTPTQTAPQTQGQASVQSPASPGAPSIPPTEDEVQVAIDESPKAPRASHHRKGEVQRYVVKTGDTLMKISFQKYGNVYRWREIYNANRAAIKNYNALLKGTILNIHGVEYVVIERNGKPYLIKRNDTLVKISRGLYGNSRYWHSLWKNNPHLIHDPNKIYADFTLYYLAHPQAPVEEVHRLSKLKRPTDNNRVPAKQEPSPGTKLSN